MSAEQIFVVRDLTAVTADQTTPAAASAVRTTANGGFSAYKAITFVANLIGATGGVLDVVIEHSPDAGTTWYEYAHFTQQANGGPAKSYIFAPAVNVAPTECGKNLTTTFVVTAGNATGGRWFDTICLRYVAGSGTSLGAAVSVKVHCVRDL